MQHSISNITDGESPEAGAIERYLAEGRMAGALRTLGAHLLEKSPSSILARLMLAKVARRNVDCLRLLAEGAALGMEQWGPELRGEREPPDWASDEKASVFLTTLMAYGHVLARAGHRTAAVEWLNLLIKVDPDDLHKGRHTAQLHGLILNDPQADRTEVHR